MEDKILPQAIDAERSVLGACLMDFRVFPEVRSVLSSEACFYRDAHRRIYRAMVSLFDGGKIVDPMLLAEEIRREGSMEIVGGFSYLADLVAEVSTTANVQHHAAIVRERFDRRKMITAAAKATTLAYNEMEDWAASAEMLQEVFSDLQDIDDDSLIEPGQMEDVRRKGLRDRAKRPEILTGLESIDLKLSEAFAPLKVSIMAGRPSMGKTAFRMVVTQNLCEQGFGVLSVCPEGGFESDMDRLDSLRHGIPLVDIIQSGRWREGDSRIKQIVDGVHQMDEKWHLYSMPSRMTSLADIRMALHRIVYVIGDPIHVVFIDLFDRMTDVDVVENKASVISVKLNEIARLAEEFNTHFCLLVQINRGVERRNDNHPTMADLRDSGGYEQVADLIFMLYRASYYNEDVEDTRLEVELGKQRNGPAGRGTRVELGFDPQTLRMWDLEDRILS